MEKHHFCQFTLWHVECSLTESLSLQIRCKIQSGLDLPWAKTVCLLKYVFSDQGLVSCPVQLGEGHLGAGPMFLPIASSSARG